MESKPWQQHYDYYVPTTIRYPRIPVQGIFQCAASQYPDRAAYNFYGSELTFWGDIAQTDEDGYFRIVDRKKDMIIAGGFNIYPREVDEVLCRHPKISEAVTVGVPDDYRGETVKVYVVLKPGQTATEKELIDFCRESLTTYKSPKVVEFRDSLPKSSVGKILHKILRDEEIAKKNKK